MLLQAGLLSYNAWHTSPTQDEPAHLVAGLDHWRTGRFDLYRVNPPLVRMIAALPVLTQGPASNVPTFNRRNRDRGVGKRPVFLLGSDFVAAHGAEFMIWLRMARLTLLPFTLLGTYVCYRFSKDLFSPVAGIGAAILWATQPWVLGHGCLITPDTVSASFAILNAYAFYKWLGDPTTRRTLIFAMTLGLTVLTKFTLVVLPVLWLAILGWQMIWNRHSSQGRRGWADLWRYVIACVIALVVIQLGYFFEKPVTKLGDFVFVSQSLGGPNVLDGGSGNRFQDTFWSNFPIPVPRNLVMGIDVQQRDFEDFHLSNYLLGIHRDEGWPSYYLHALILKSTLGFLALMALRLFALAPRGQGSSSSRGIWVLLLPSLVILLVASLKTGLNHHGRYILVCIPFWCVWVSGVFDSRARLAFHRPGHSRAMPRSVAWISWSLLVLHVTSSLFVFPHSLSFFQVAVGGPRHGPEYLLGSNVDWGQDLLWLRRWRDEHADIAGEKTHLAFEGQYNPFVLLDSEGEKTIFDDWPFDENTSDILIPVDDTFAISTNLLFGVPVVAVDRSGAMRMIDRCPFEFLRSIEPIGWAGHSIRIYSAEQLSRAYRAAQASSETH